MPTCSPRLLCRIAKNKEEEAKCNLEIQNAMETQRDIEHKASELSITISTVEAEMVSVQQEMDGLECKKAEKSNVGRGACAALPNWRHA